MQPERLTETVQLAQPTPSAVYTTFVKKKKKKKKKKKISDESIDESFFKAKPLWRHHFKGPTEPRLLCGPGFLIGSLHADYELFMSLFSRVTVHTKSL